MLLLLILYSLFLTMQRYDFFLNEIEFCVLLQCDFMELPAKLHIKSLIYPTCFLFLPYSEEDECVVRFGFVGMCD